MPLDLDGHPIYFSRLHQLLKDFAHENDNWIWGNGYATSHIIHGFRRGVSADSSGISTANSRVVFNSKRASSNALQKLTAPLPKPFICGSKSFSLSVDIEAGIDSQNNSSDLLNTHAFSWTARLEPWNISLDGARRTWQNRKSSAASRILNTTFVPSKLLCSTSYTLLTGVAMLSIWILSRLHRPSVHHPPNIFYFRKFHQLLLLFTLVLWNSILRVCSDSYSEARMGYAGYVQRVESNRNKISGLTDSLGHTDIRIIHSLLTALSLITSYLRHLAYGPVSWVGMANIQPALCLKTVEKLGGEIHLGTWRDSNLLDISSHCPR